MDSLFGIPSHPFFIHLPLVLVPALGVAAVLLAARPQLRRRFGVALLGGTLVGAIATILAASSGGALQRDLRPQIGNLAKDHASLGETTRLFTIALVIAVAVMVTLDRRSHRSGTSELPASAAAGVAAVLGVLATIWMLRTGHEGARIVWDS